MGVIYVAVSLDEDLARWLDEQDIAHPAVSENNRNPTPSEVLAAIAAIPDCEHEVQRSPNSNDIDVRLDHRDGRWTRATMSEEIADVLPCSLSFHKGWDDLAIEVLRGCTAQCGTLVLFRDTGEPPTIVA